MRALGQSRGLWRILLLLSTIVFLAGVVQIDPLIGRWWENDPDTLMLLGLGGLFVGTQLRNQQR